MAEEVGSQKRARHFFIIRQARIHHLFSLIIKIPTRCPILEWYVLKSLVDNVFTTYFYFFKQQLNEKEETDGDVEVSWVDQQRINEFSKYNAKIDDLEDQYEKLKVVLFRC